MLIVAPRNDRAVTSERERVLPTASNRDNAFQPGGNVEPRTSWTPPHDHSSHREAQAEGAVIRVECGHCLQRREGGDRVGLTYLSARPLGPLYNSPIACQGDEVASPSGDTHDICQLRRSRKAHAFLPDSKDGCCHPP